jgi:hypothetical protein
MFKYSKQQILRIFSGSDDECGAALRARSWLDGLEDMLHEDWIPKPKEPVKKLWPFK